MVSSKSQRVPGERARDTTRGEKKAKSSDAQTYRFKANRAMNDRATSSTRIIHEFLAVFQHIRRRHALFDSVVQLAALRSEFVLVLYQHHCSSNKMKGGVSAMISEISEMIA